MPTISGESCQYARFEHLGPSDNMGRAGLRTTVHYKETLCIGRGDRPSLDERESLTAGTPKSRPADRVTTSESEACGRTAA